MLGPFDAVPGVPRRILVAGTSGSGKSTLAARIAAVTGAPYREIDALHHGPRWVPRPEFGEEVDAFTAQPSWVTEWQYASVRELLADRAEVLVWLDLPRRIVMWRVVKRTVSRRIRRVELWNGNQEPPLRAFLTDRNHIVRWAWRTHAGWRDLVATAAAGHPHLIVVRLRHPREVEAWLTTLP